VPLAATILPYTVYKYDSTLEFHCNQKQYSTPLVTTPMGHVMFGTGCSEKIYKQSTIVFNPTLKLGDLW
jgi:hypothetical protein